MIFRQQTLDKRGCLAHGPIIRLYVVHQEPRPIGK